ncbi:MAG: serpin family protein [Nocardioidaceae bacterium]
MAGGTTVLRRGRDRDGRSRARSRSEPEQCGSVPGRCGPAADAHRLPARASDRVEMPRWKFRVREQLNEYLVALGMYTAFDAAEADFSGMTTQEPLCIGHVLHEAFIAVDEEGTEAAAATAVAMVVAGLRIPASPPLTLIADRPFLFVVFDKATATPLFIGRVRNPTQ